MRKKDKDITKLDPRGERGIFVGYTRKTSGYRIWRPDTDLVYETKQVEIFEDLNGFEEVIKPELPSETVFELDEVFQESFHEVEEPLRGTSSTSSYESETEVPHDSETETDSDDEVFQLISPGPTPPQPRPPLNRPPLMRRTLACPDFELVTSSRDIT